MKWTLQRQKESFFRFTILTAFFRCCFLKAFHGNKTRQELARFGCLEFKPYSQLNSHLTMQQYKTLQRRHTLRNSERSLYGRVLKQCFKSALSSPLERSSRLTTRHEKQNKDDFFCSARSIVATSRRKSQIFSYARAERCSALSSLRN